MRDQASCTHASADTVTGSRACSYSFTYTHARARADPRGDAARIESRAVERGTAMAEHASRRILAGVFTGLQRIAKKSRLAHCLRRGAAAQYSGRRQCTRVF